jgi:hypothetical protein
VSAADIEFVVLVSRTILQLGLLCGYGLITVLFVLLLVRMFGGIKP